DVKTKILKAEEEESSGGHVEIYRCVSGFRIAHYSVFCSRKTFL
ncbi:unnamed protein product, partial [Larinioides sclopetarius]